ncbi:MAG TPA: hypothetical protein DCW72_00670 [Elusimicrobia bacterium]|nr:MAG: hypothetical protein A2X29_04625 [Elusimicrobia bacterium GWA2_64_40]OGR65820.1 MAG: hypothetical protein A2X30_10175 [Elusimicrobia bacterium GWB2_63_16]HAN05589.1 hypothetical protein [Elusimicrobiota bacterium]HAU88786.1 hypothetical protein [Elusimicrobiota bacterium]
MGLPEEVATARAWETVTYYILKQTHEPLFRTDEGENFHSRILKKWEKDILSGQYLFCPDTDKEFDKDHAFGPEFFSEYITKTTSKYARNFSVERRGGCFSVSFPSPQKGYIEFLSRYENAPSIRQTDKVEMGLGEFFVGSMGGGKIVLRRKKPVPNGYSEIVLNEYSPAKAKTYDYGRISDFNKIPVFDVPREILSGFATYNNIELRSDVLIINHPDAEVRKRIYNCLDADRFRRAFFPQKNDFYNISNVLPVGVSGAVPGLPLQDCSALPKFGGRSRDLVLFNHRSGNIEQLAAVAEEFWSRTGLKINVVSRTPKELSPFLHKYPRPYNMVVISLDTVTPAYESFFGFIVRPDGYFNQQDPVLKKIFDEISRDTDPGKRALLVDKFLGELHKRYLILPLYQNVKELYYPRRIKNFIVGREFMTYPEVADFRW